jgi:hypothetical protein
MIFFFMFMLMSLLAGSEVEVPLIIVAAFHYTVMSPAGPFQAHSDHFGLHGSACPAECLNSANNFTEVDEGAVYGRTLKPKAAKDLGSLLPI